MMCDNEAKVTKGRRSSVSPAIKDLRRFAAFATVPPPRKEAEMQATRHLQHEAPPLRPGQAGVGYPQDGA